MRWSIQVFVAIGCCLSAANGFSVRPVSRTAVPPPPLHKSALSVHNDVVEKERHNPTPVLVAGIQEWMPKQGMMSVFAMAFLAVSLISVPFSADAAMSGGRMGGSFGSAGRSSMMRTPSSYGGGGGRSSYGSGFSRGFGAGMGAGYMAAPRVQVYGSPFGYYGGGGVVSYGGGFNLFPLLFLGATLYIASQAVQNTLGRGISGNFWNDNDDDDDGFVFGSTSALGSGVSVLKMSVALEVPDRDDPNSILSVLSRLAETAKTDSRVGIQNLTSQVALELLRRKASIVSAASDSKHFGDRARAVREYSGMSIEERGKFERETVSRYGGVDYTAGAAPASVSSNDKATMAVVTILLAIEGDSIKIPSRLGSRNVEEALRKIATDAKVENCLQSAEILWTPEDRSEQLAMRDVLADYPDLQTI